MKIISVTDEDTKILFNLIGIEGYDVSSKALKEFREFFIELLKDENIGIILMNEKYLLRDKEFFRKIKLQF